MFYLLLGWRCSFPTTFIMGDNLLNIWYLTYKLSELNYQRLAPWYHCPHGVGDVEDDDDDGHRHAVHGLAGNVGHASRFKSNLLPCKLLHLPEYHLVMSPPPATCPFITSIIITVRYVCVKYRRGTKLKCKPYSS